MARSGATDEHRVCTELYRLAVRAGWLVSCSAALVRSSSCLFHCFSLRWCSRKPSTSAPSVASERHMPPGSDASRGEASKDIM